MYECHVELLEVANVPISRFDKRPNLFIVVQLLDSAYTVSFLNSHASNNNNTNNNIPDNASANSEASLEQQVVPTYRTTTFTNAHTTLNLQSSFIMKLYKREKGILLVQVFDQYESSEGLLSQFQIPVGGPGRAFGCRKMTCQSFTTDVEKNNTSGNSMYGTYSAKAYCPTTTGSSPQSTVCTPMTVQVAWRVATSNSPLSSFDNKFEESDQCNNVTLSPVVIHRFIPYTGPSDPFSNTNTTNTTNTNTSDPLHTDASNPPNGTSDSLKTTSSNPQTPNCTINIARQIIESTPCLSISGSKTTTIYNNNNTENTTATTTPLIIHSREKTQREVDLEQDLSALRAKLTLRKHTAVPTPNSNITTIPLSDTTEENQKKSFVLHFNVNPIYKDSIINPIADTTSERYNNNNTINNNNNNNNSTVPSYLLPSSHYITPLKVDIQDKENSCVGKCSNLQSILAKPCQVTTVEEPLSVSSNCTNSLPDHYNYDVYRQTETTIRNMSPTSRQQSLRQSNHFSYPLYYSGVPDLRPHHGYAEEAAYIFGGDIPFSANLTAGASVASFGKKHHQCHANSAGSLSGGCGNNGMYTFKGKGSPSGSSRRSSMASLSFAAR